MSLPFEYIHKTNKKSKNIRLKVEKGGKVVVTSPNFIPKFVIDRFVKKHQDWIERALKKSSNSEKFDSENHIFVFGKEYQKEIAYSEQTKSGVYISGEKMIFNPLTPVDFKDETAKNRAVKKFRSKSDQFLKNTAGHYIIARTHKLAKKMELKFNKITLKKQKTRWGSCSSKRNLNFNWKLAHFDTNIIDYVIIHELSHLVHMDHSKDFWELVKKFDPEYLNHRGWLKRNGLSLD